MDGEELDLDLDRERQEKAREYARIRRRLMLLDLLLGTVYLLMWLIAGWGPLLLHRLQRGTLLGPVAWWVELLIMAGALGIPYWILTLPVRFYRGYILPHRYELSTQDLRGWAVDLMKGSLVSLALGVPLLVGLYALIRAFPANWWLWAAGLYTLVSAVLATLAPVLLLPLFFDPEPLGEEYQDLKARLLNLAERAGTEISGVYKIDMSRRTVAANAALTGLGRTRRILLGDTLLDKFSADEIETVLAHELGHHLHGDIPRSLLFQTALNFAAFYVLHLALRWAAPDLGLSSPADPAGLPFIGLLFGVFGLVTMPLANAYSRWRERLADRFALQATGKPAAFARAMTRLANQNLAEADPEQWVVWLLYSHPPLNERIGLARKAARS